MHHRDTVADLASCDTTRTFDGPLLDRNDRDRPLCEWYNRGPRLPSRPLLDQDQFAAVIIDERAIEQKNCLKGKMNFTVEILMQAVVVAGTVFEEQRGRAGLPGFMASKNQEPRSPFGFISQSHTKTSQNCD